MFEHFCISINTNYFYPNPALKRVKEIEPYNLILKIVSAHSKPIVVFKLLFSKHASQWDKNPHHFSSHTYCCFAS